MTDVQQRAAAKQFVSDWTGRGDEKQETALFWTALLSKVYGVSEPDKYIQFELPVKLGHVSFIDGYIETTRVLIEQKGRDIGLKKGEKQSDGSVLTPYQQARRYAGNLPHNQNPRWIVVCNFREFHIHDMNRPNDEPEVIALADLEKEYYRLNFLVDTGNTNVNKEMEISLQAGELVGVLYDALLKQYKEPDSPETLKSLNALCVRLVFCLYAEDAGIFGGRSAFHNYFQKRANDARRALMDLFKVLDTKPEDRDPYLDDDLLAFPYVNGGLFADETLIIPRLDKTIVDLILRKASEDFDWSEISPTIFGAVFESTLNPETRRSGGMHYTSIENIHKVIDPLFLNGLTADLEKIRGIPMDKEREARLDAFQNKLSCLTFLDPACGSGNFLTETYISLRRLENRVIALKIEASRKQVGGQIMLGGGGEMNPIRVSIHQFYGIEINDFAVTVAKTALWIAESQMMKETEDVVHMSLDFLPLKSYANITEGNALRLDWESVVPKSSLNYIMGNPPFVGYSLQSKKQKEDILTVYVDEKGKPYKSAGKIDYVAGWYFKASQFMQNTITRTAFVSTNSITQGEQVAGVWRPLYDRFDIHIDFAHRTFRWDSEASLKAHVHCVIVGFSIADNQTEKRLYTADRMQIVNHINPYLVDGPIIFVEDRKTPLCSGVTIMNKGSQGTDNGLFYFSPDEYDELCEKYSDISKFLREVHNGQTFISKEKRYCLWCAGLNPAELKKYPELMDRIQKVKQYRLDSPKEATRKWADYPYLFTENRQPTDGNYLLVPLTSSEKRRYVPIGYLPCDVIANNSVQMVPNATLYDFGILNSNVFMAWMRAVCGRLEMRYRITVTNVYNNFPWPEPNEEQRTTIERTAQAILDARALYPDNSLADLYDELTMPPELRKAHQDNDKAVMRAYGFWGKYNSESACVAQLMKLYQNLTKA